MGKGHAKDEARRLPALAPQRAPSATEALRAAEFVRIYTELYVANGRISDGDPAVAELRAVLAEGPLDLTTEQIDEVYSYAAAFRAHTVHEEDRSSDCSRCGDVDDPRRDPLYHPEGLL